MFSFGDLSPVTNLTQRCREGQPEMSDLVPGGCSAFSSGVMERSETLQPEPNSKAISQSH